MSKHSKSTTRTESLPKRYETLLYQFGQAIGTVEQKSGPPPPPPVLSRYDSLKRIANILNTVPQKDATNDLVDVGFRFLNNVKTASNNKDYENTPIWGALMTGLDKLPGRLVPEGDTTEPPPVHIASELKKFIDQWQEIRDTLKSDVKQKRRADQNETRREGRRETIRSIGLPLIGVEDLDIKNVVFIDVTTPHPITKGELLAGFTKNEEGQYLTEDSDVIPEGRTSNNKFTGRFLSDEDIKDFKTFDHGCVYFMDKAEDGKYHFVGAARWWNEEDLKETEMDHLQKMTDYGELCMRYGYEVTENASQNANPDGARSGCLNCGGWHPVTAKKKSVALYAAGKAGKQDMGGYFDFQRQASHMAKGIMHFQTIAAPAYTARTSEYLQKLGVPIFGETGVDFAAHGPGLGSNIAVSMHDDNGDNFANGAHVDRDIDSLSDHHGQVHTAGAWWYSRSGVPVTNKETVQSAMNSGYFVFPGWGIKLDLTSAVFLTALWRGGMDEHCTSKSSVNLNEGVIRWGCSIQTTRALPKRIESKKARFGATELAEEYGFKTTG